ncbi:MAG: peptidoglycan DD-metalloendopeptidase family protein, partial [Acidobacteria bacterium]|nr:peptidoglycan DD-metalloendopeptidase family protein [Acidobacteriota bacterium]
AALVVLLSGCSSFETLTSPFSAPSPREVYLRGLEQADLTATAMARSWIEAGDRALAQALPLEGAMHEVLYFDPAEPRAVAYRIDLHRGERLEVRVTPPAGAPALFFDGFRPATPPEDEPEPVRLDEADDGWVREVRDDETLILRLQPQLLAGGAYDVALVVAGSLAFPVEGRDRRAVGSVFGDPRDGGARRHEGVDIFAPRGTPAVAADEGFVTRTGTNRLGGNVVWVRTDGGLALYYAHLDSVSTHLGSRVAPGDPLGTVGNTGNARTSPPHLHFGVYDGGAVDPLPFFGRGREAPPVTADQAVLGRFLRIQRDGVRVRSEPSTRGEIVAELPRGTALEAVGARRDWYRFEVPGGPTGYVAGWLTEPTDRPLSRRRLEMPEPLHARPAANAAVIALLLAGQEVEILGSLDGRLLVRSDAGQGWIEG